jgi:hypothetical protein
MSGARVETRRLSSYGVRALDVVVIVETLLLALTLLLWWQFSWVAPPLLRRGWTTTAATATYRAACSVVRRCEWRRRERERGLTAGCARRALFLLCGVPDAWVSSFVISKVQKQKTKKKKVCKKAAPLFYFFSSQPDFAHNTAARHKRTHGVGGGLARGGRLPPARERGGGRAAWGHRAGAPAIFQTIHARGHIRAVEVSEREHERALQHRCARARLTPSPPPPFSALDKCCGGVGASDSHPRRCARKRISSPPKKTRAFFSPHPRSLN